MVEESFKSIIEVKNLVKEFPKFSGWNFPLLKPKITYVKALDNISFEIKEGEILGLLGPNGAGKTTLVRILSGILIPTEGEVKVLGLTPYKDRIRLVKNIGVVFGHKSQLFPNLTPKESIRIISMYYNVSREEFEDKFYKYVEYLEVEHLVDRKVKTLSLGERMRFEIIASLIHNPKILFLDEPTIGLDFSSKFKIRRLIRSLKDKTIIFTSHDALDIEEICKRVIILNKGKIVLDTTVRNLKKILGYKIVEIVLDKEFLDNIDSLYKKENNVLVGKISSFDKVLEIIKRLNDLGYKILDISFYYPSIEEILDRIYRNV